MTITGARRALPAVYTAFAAFAGVMAAAGQTAAHRTWGLAAAVSGAGHVRVFARMSGGGLILGRFGHKVVAAVADAPALITAATDHAPDIVVTGVRMPPGFRDEGLRAALELRQKRPGAAIFVLSQYVEHSYAADLLQTGGGVGYLLKDRVGDVAEFVDAVERVAAGGTVMDPEVVRRLLSRRRDRAPIERLTERAREVLTLMAEGRSNGAIARQLVVSDAAVGKHVGLDLHEARPAARARGPAVFAHLWS